MTEKIVDRAQIINVGVGSFKDPAYLSGLYIASLSIYQTYRVDRDKVQDIQEKLYQHLLNKLEKQKLGDAQFRIFNYREEPMILSQVNSDEYDNADRTYFLITRDTLRSTRATILVRFLTYGENLYVGVDTFMLGKLSIFALITKVVLTVIIPFLVAAPLSFIPGINLLFWLLYLCLNAFTWRRLIQRILQLGDIGMACRLEFNKINDVGSFNFDDIIMFVKSSLFMTVTSIRDVFEQEGLPIESLNAFIQSINNINVNTSGGNINMTNSTIGVANKTSSSTTIL